MSVSPTPRRAHSAIAILLFLLTCSSARSAPRHPDLILNSKEIIEIREKLRTQPWAARVVEKMKDEVQRQDEKANFRVSAAVLYALTGERQFAQTAYGA